MGFFTGFFGGFAKGMAREMIKAALAEAITQAHVEIDSHKGTTPEEKATLKQGVALLVKRVDAALESRLK